MPMPSCSLALSWAINLALAKVAFDTSRYIFCPVFHIAYIYVMVSRFFHTRQYSRLVLSGFGKGYSYGPKRCSTRLWRHLLLAQCRCRRCIRVLHCYLCLDEAIEHIFQSAPRLFLNVQAECSTAFKRKHNLEVQL